MKVLKFGGTSVGRPERLDDLAAIVGTAWSQGPLAIVVSALAGVTDDLEAALAAAENGEPSLGLLRRLRQRHLDDPAGRLDAEAKRDLEAALEPRFRELERLLEGAVLLGEVPRHARHRCLATGERLAVQRVTAWLRAAGVDAVPVDGTDLLRVIDDGPEAVVDTSATRGQVIEGLGQLFAGQVPVITGFFGADDRGRTVTLGRGASDLVATVLAAALDADAVEIWTDTDGVFSADPRRIDEAAPIRHLGYSETAALARYGAKVLHPRSLDPVARVGLPLWVRSTFQADAPGTRIDPACAADGLLPDAPTADVPSSPAKAVSTTRAVRLDLVAPHGARLVGRTMSALERVGVDPLTIRRTPKGLTMTVRALDADAARHELERETRHLPVRIEVQDGLAAIGVLPGKQAASTLVGEIPNRLVARGLRVFDIFLDGGDGVTVAAAIVPEQEADLAVAHLHHELVHEAPRLRVAS
ncbi:MAG: aspartate kinase [Acidobacteriota bacterium]